MLLLAAHRPLDSRFPREQPDQGALPLQSRDRASGFDHHRSGLRARRDVAGLSRARSRRLRCRLRLSNSVIAEYLTLQYTTP